MPTLMPTSQQAHLDAAGAVEVLNSMKLAGLQPDQVDAPDGWMGGWRLQQAQAESPPCSYSPTLARLTELPPLPCIPLAPFCFWLQTSFTHAIETMVRAGQPQMALQLCAEAHEVGALRAYSLPSLAGGAPQPGTALGNALDLR